MFEWGTVKNTVFHLIPWYGNFVERHSFHTRKLGEVTVFFVEYASHKYEIQQYYSKPILYQYKNYTLISDLRKCLNVLSEKHYLGTTKVLH